MFAPESTTEEQLRILAASTTDLSQAMAAREEQRRRLQAELDELRRGLCSALMHSRDGRVGNPLIVNLLLGIPLPWQRTETT